MRRGAYGARRGQALVETVAALLALVVCFFLLFQYADNLRAKLLCEYAAARAARAATIGLNDYMVRKTAEIATMSAAGKCLVQDDAGHAPGPAAWIARAPDYLECTYEAQARQVLDFDYWHNRTHVSAVRAGAKIVATVRQDRPQFFSLARYLDGTATAGDDEAHITGTAEIEAHYPDWLP